MKPTPLTTLFYSTLSSLFSSACSAKDFGYSLVIKWYRALYNDTSFIIYNAGPVEWDDREDGPIKKKSDGPGNRTETEMSCEHLKMVLLGGDRRSCCKAANPAVTPDRGCMITVLLLDTSSLLRRRKTPESPSSLMGCKVLGTCTGGWGCKCWCWVEAARIRALNKNT